MPIIVGRSGIQGDIFIAALLGAGLAGYLLTMILLLRRLERQVTSHAERPLRPESRHDAAG